MITIKSLKIEIEFFKQKSFKFFLNHGLEKNSDQKSTISILLKNKFPQKNKIISYSFNYSDNQDENDIPFYHPGVPDGFSLFTSQNEYIKILSYIKTDDYKKGLEKRMQQSEEINLLKTEPEPKNKAFLCQICKTRFDNYYEHIKSKLHNQNKLKYTSVFNKIKLTFKRIAGANNIQKNNNNKVEEPKESTINDNNDNTLLTTKEESLPVNEDIKVNEINDMPNNNCDKEEEKLNSISVKEILNVLDTIELSKNKYGEKLKGQKRKKKNIFSNGYYIQDFQNITGKICFFNDLIKNNK